VQAGRAGRERDAVDDGRMPHQALDKTRDTHSLAIFQRLLRRRSLPHQRVVGMDAHEPVARLSCPARLFWGSRARLTNRK
jgi:hypothetical protein